MLELQSEDNEDNDELLSRNLRYRQGKWWRREGAVSAMLLTLLSAIAMIAGLGLVIASYNVLCSPG